MKVSEFSTQDVGNVLWAFAKLGGADPTTIAALEQQVIATAQELNLRQTAIIIWAVAKLRYTSE